MAPPILVHAPARCTSEQQPREDGVRDQQAFAREPGTAAVRLHKSLRGELADVPVSLREILRQPVAVNALAQTQPHHQCFTCTPRFVEVFIVHHRVLRRERGVLLEVGLVLPAVARQV